MGRDETLDGGDEPELLELWKLAGQHRMWTSVLEKAHTHHTSEHANVAEQP